MADRRRVAGSGFRWPVLVLVALVSLTTAYIWTKVQMAKTLKQAEAAQARIRGLEEEQDKLVAAVAFRKKPGIIREIAQRQLGMIDPAGKLAEVVVDHGSAAQE